MGTQLLRVENNKIMKIYLNQETGFEYMPVDHDVVNGWDCWINSDDSLCCMYEKEYSDGYYGIRYNIYKNGFSKLSLKTPEDKEFRVLKKGFVTPKGVPFTSGIVGLANGSVWQRYAYFRSLEFQDFLDRTGITAVKHENPNRVYSHVEEFSPGFEAWNEVWSDGKVAESEVVNDFRNYTVSGATWAVEETRHIYKRGDINSHAVILYTQEKNVMALEKAIMDAMYE